MNPLPSPPISPKNRVIKQPNQRTKLLPTIRKGRLTDRTQTAGQHRINKHHHHARPTRQYKYLGALLTLNSRHSVFIYFKPKSCKKKCT